MITDINNHEEMIEYLGKFIEYPNEDFYNKNDCLIKENIYGFNYLIPCNNPLGRKLYDIIKEFYPAEVSGLEPCNLVWYSTHLITNRSFPWFRTM